LKKNKIKMSKYEYKIVLSKGADKDALQSVLNDHASKGWELDQIFGWTTSFWLILKRKI
jgi:hypothetical protein